MSLGFGMDGAITENKMHKSDIVSGEQVLTYAEAIRDATHMAMKRDENILVFGEGVNDSGAIFGTTKGLHEEFGIHRMIETPLSENGITGICAGAAMGGLRPILIHQRVDFALLAMDQLFNHAAKWRYMTGGKVQIPFVLRCLIGKGWGQAAQHSQSLQATFAHFPGVRVLMPSTPSDAKGLLLAALQENNPTILLEARGLYSEKEPVAQNPFTTPIGKAAVRKVGSELTVIGSSYLMPEIMRVAQQLENEIDIEVIDLRTISPLDRETLTKSVSKTGRALVVDTSWKSFGISAEISALLHESCFDALDRPVMRLALPDVPTPCSPELEKYFYPSAASITQAILELAKD